MRILPRSSESSVSLSAWRWRPRGPGRPGLDVVEAVRGDVERDEVDRWPLGNGPAGDGGADVFRREAVGVLAVGDDEQMAA